ncbi:hypothetical protein JCM33374_g4837 [Metschnikowia sp. JCM 33374]|nr:hypothetical protein JCM33374_g4837 [Metschnikowia sp. JCM 33374]
MATIEYIQRASAGLPSSVTPADKVYKDDCMYSFDSAENNALGLDVCMTCFQAFSRAVHKDYTAEHYSHKRHPLFVNIKKQLKRKPEPASEDEDNDIEEGNARHKVPKLEIVEEKESDLYDISTSIYVAPLADSVEIDLCSSAVQKLANEILSANSASVTDDIKAWESQVFPCEHSLALQTPTTPEIPVELSHCAMCDLKENLWICLSCGAIGCGREQFGSSLKGNSHALSHYELTGHQVAVKLGSLSADNEDSCDCYCYQCNDEVKVPELTQKLLPFGVDLSSAVKSEKNLIELNLDTNKSWQFNLDGASGEKLTPAFGPGLTGLSNLGNSCYLNSVIQVLFSLDSYRAFFGSLGFDDSVSDAALDLPSQMIKLHDGLVSGRYSKPSALKGDDYQAGIKPSSFKALIGADHHEFKTNKQQDANEFLLYLFDKLDKQFGLALNKDFKFLLGSKVGCSNCNHGSKTSNLVDNISVPIENKVIGFDEDGKKIYEEVELSDSFKAFFAKEPIENYKCENCGDSKSTAKQEGFVTFPQNLIVSVQRITLENWVPVKQEIPIAIPEEIDVSCFKAPSFGEGETEIKPEEQSKCADKFVPNEEALSLLLGMGFSEPRCMRALYNTGNKDAEEAMNWLFAHMDDADIDDPFDPTKTGSSDASASEISPESIDNLVSMGFSALLAKKALVLNQNDVNASVEWLFNNPDDDGIIHEESKPVVNLEKETTDLSSQLESEADSHQVGKYTLKAVICHKGTSPHTGHYVAFIKLEGEWFLFNDEKVVRCGESIEDIKKNAYIYFFEKH